MSILGIDPGAEGALALLDDRAGLIRVADIPVVEVLVGRTKRHRMVPSALAALIRGMAPDHVIIERVQGFPTDAPVYAFNFGYAAGCVEGVVAALGIPVSFVTPIVWKKQSGVTKDKETCRQAALQLWPTHAGDFARKKDQDRAEAALIGRWGILMGGLGITRAAA